MYISFTPINSFVENCIAPPVPAKLCIPDWYKSMPNLSAGETQVGLDLVNKLAPNTTVKSCSPFLDALSFGYVWSTPFDLEIRKDEKNIVISWRNDYSLVAQHTRVQYPGFKKFMNTQQDILKWEFPFTIKTPPGYSTVFTHPFNRNDLFFNTLTGIVDTDSYEIPVTFPFSLKEDLIPNGITIVEKGTPVCQFFPVKREPWVSKINKCDEKIYEKNRFNFNSKIVRAYKTSFWQKKSFS